MITKEFGKPADKGDFEPGFTNDHLGKNNRFTPKHLLHLGHHKLGIVKGISPSVQIYQLVNV